MNIQSSVRSALRSSPVQEAARLDVAKIREDFPILQQAVHGKNAAERGLVQQLAHAKQICAGMISIRSTPHEGWKDRQNGLIRGSMPWQRNLFQSVTVQ